MYITFFFVEWKQQTKNIDESSMYVNIMNTMQDITSYYVVIILFFCLIICIVRGSFFHKWASKNRLHAKIMFVKWCFVCLSFLNVKNLYSEIYLDNTWESSLYTQRWVHCLCFGKIFLFACKIEPLK